MSARLKPATALAFALVAACSDDPVEPANQFPASTRAPGLTEMESVALFRGIAELAFSDAHPIHPVNLAHPGSLMITCPQGGEVALTEINTELPDIGSQEEMRVAFTILPTRCEVMGEGSTFIMDGAPGLSAVMDIETVRPGVGETVRTTGTIAGDLGWQLPQRAGGCRIRGTLNAWTSIPPDPDARRTGSFFSGSVCGHAVMIDTSKLSIPPHFPT